MSEVFGSYLFDGFEGIALRCCLPPVVTKISMFAGQNLARAKLHAQVA